MLSVYALHLIGEMLLEGFPKSGWHSIKTLENLVALPDCHRQAWADFTKQEIKVRVIQVWPWIVRVLIFVKDQVHDPR